MSATPTELVVLGIETSCDETAAAVVRGIPPGPGQILSNVVHHQIENHEPYGGVVPEIAARAHVELLDSVIARALSDAGKDMSQIDGFAATAGPGLIGGVMVGLLSAKALALAMNKPLVALNHLEAHALSARLVEGTEFPFLLLLISGGHCQLMAAEGVGKYNLYGATIDDAVGEAFDKVAKLIGLPYPGGPEIERAARQGNPERFAFPRPMLGRRGMEFSFSGLKTAVRQIAGGVPGGAPNIEPKLVADFAASFQAAVVDVLVDRARIAMRKFRSDFGCPKEAMDFVVAGGVASNRSIAAALKSLAAEEGFRLSLPPPALCTDNGAMVAWAGLERLSRGLTDALGSPPRARWPLESPEHIA
jgi:N6-L-threonylcarbamoyladenine synthase